MTRRLFYPVFGLLLVPLVMGAFLALLNLLQNSLNTFSDAMLPFIVGILCYLVLQWVFRKPMGAYVMGHEITHALAGMLSGARIKSFSVSDKGGEVSLTKTNIFIVLAPYLIPLYTLFVILGYKICGLYQDVSRFSWLYMFFVGGTWAFHIALTSYALRIGQQDMKYAGIVLSGALIILSNSIALAILLKILYPDKMFLLPFARDTVYNTFHVWAWIVKHLQNIGTA